MFKKKKSLLGTRSITMWVLFIGDLHKPNYMDECPITLASSSASGSDWCISSVWWVGSEPLTYSSLCRQRTICSIWGVSALFLWKTRHKINTLKAKLFRTIEGEGGTFVILWGTFVIKKHVYIFLQILFWKIRMKLFFIDY
jgi:hypothetical protein